MKKVLMLLLAVASVGMLSSCNKDDDGGPSSVFKVTVDGDDFNFSEVEGYTDGDFVYVGGFDDDEENYVTIDFDTDDVDDTGSYDIEDGDVSIYFWLEDGDVTLYAVEGEFDITTLSDTRLEATFEGIATPDFSDEVDFEDGQVKVTLEED